MKVDMEHLLQNQRRISGDYTNRRRTLERLSHSNDWHGSTSAEYLNECKLDEFQRWFHRLEKQASQS